jgi:hypothetical protein
MTIQKEILSLWTEIGRPHSNVTGIEYEDSSISTALTSLSFHSLVECIECWETKYPLSNLNLDYAVYLCGAYLIYGYNNWLCEDCPDVIDDNLIIDFSAFVGKKFTTDEIFLEAGQARLGYLTIFLGELMFEKQLNIREDRKNNMLNRFWEFNHKLTL